MTFSEFTAQLTAALVPVLVAFLVALAGAGCNYVVKLVKQKAGDVAATNAARYLDMLDKALVGAIMESGQNAVDELRRSGRWNAETAKTIKRQTVANALDALGAAKGEIEANLLVDLPKYANGRLEYLLGELKKNNVLVPAPKSYVKQ